MKVLFFLTSKLVVTNCPNILPGIIFVFVRAQKSNSIPLYYNTSRASSQENFQIFFRTFVRTEHTFFLLGSNIRSFYCQTYRAAVVHRTYVRSSCKSCKKAAAKFMTAANFHIIQFFSSCKL